VGNIFILYHRVRIYCTIPSDIVYLFETYTIFYSIFIFRIIIGDDIEKDESLALVNAGKNHLSYNISSFANENFIQVAYGK